MGALVSGYTKKVISNDDKQWLHEEGGNYEKKEVTSQALHMTNLIQHIQWVVTHPYNFMTFNFVNAYEVDVSLSGQQDLGFGRLL